MNTKIILLGEAWDEHEARLQTPFIGPAGQELSRMLANAGFPCDFLPYNFNSPVRMLNYWSKFPFPLLNVFSEQPPENDVEFFYTKTKTPSLFQPRRFNSITHLKPEYEHHVVTLHNILKELKPNVIIALGNTALWALGLPTSISKLRGNVVNTPFGKVIPTYCPTSVLRKWEQRIVVVLDLHKALRESAYPEIKTLNRKIWTEPTVPDLFNWWELYGSKTDLLAFDIETVGNKQISEISFAADSTHAIHIPFFYKESKYFIDWSPNPESELSELEALEFIKMVLESDVPIPFSYKKLKHFINWWPNPESELEAWKFVKMVLESDVPKIGQNCVQYDCYWLLKEMRIGVKNVVHDTMQLAHAWQPELEKNLGFLGSVFLDEVSWKGIRTETNKQND